MLRPSALFTVVAETPDHRITATTSKNSASKRQYARCQFSALPFLVSALRKRRPPRETEHSVSPPSIDGAALQYF